MFAYLHPEYSLRSLCSGIQVLGGCILEYNSREVVFQNTKLESLYSGIQALETCILEYKSRRLYSKI